MITRAKQLANHPAVSKTVTVTIGSFIGSVFAYMLQILLGRWLSVESFGIFTALLSLYVIFGVLTTAVLTSLVKLVSKLSAEGKFDILTNLFVELTVGVLSMGAVLFLVIFFFKNQLGSFLAISDLNLFIYFGIFVAVSFLILLPHAYLQGLLRFRAYAFFSAFSQFLRLAIPVTAVLLGFGLYGVFIGMGLASVISYLIGLLMLKRNFSRFGRLSLKPYYKNIMGFAAAVLFVQIGMTMLSNMDVILVKHFFDEYSAGLYAGLVTVGKVLLFGASTVSVVMYPVISTAFEKGENYLAKFKPFLFLQIFVVFIGITAFTMFPRLITQVMFGDSYLPSAQFLPRFALFVGAIVLINFSVLFLLAINKVKVFWLFLPAIAAQIILISSFHESIVSIVNVNFAVSASLLFGVVLYSIKNVGIRNNSSVQAGRND